MTVSEFDPPVEVPAQTRVARDLTAILDLYGQLPGEAVADSADPMMPGGHAMVALAPVANLEAWGHLHQATERARRHRHPSGRPPKVYTFVEDEDPDDAWPAFQLIAYWSAAWRREFDAEYDDRRPTLPSEVNFLRFQLEWAWEHEIHWDNFAKDINRARVKLEDVLFAGSRVEKTRVVCPDCDKEIRLVVLRGSEPEDDRWKCHGCKRRFNQDDVRRAHAKMLRSAGAERWIEQRDAIDVLKGQGRTETTVRRWLAQGEGEGYCDPFNHTVWVWWPSLWRKHLMTPTRRSSAGTTPDAVGS